MFIPAGMWSGWWCGIQRASPWLRRAVWWRFNKILQMRFYVSTIRLLCVAALVLAASNTRAQNWPPPAIIRSETRVVLADAVAVDKKNKFVRDLTKKDFRIRED